MKSNCRAGMERVQGLDGVFFVFVGMITLTLVKAGLGSQKL